jgi:hypothetical protein
MSTDVCLSMDMTDCLNIADVHVYIKVDELVQVHLHVYVQEK